MRLRYFVLLAAAASLFAISVAPASQGAAPVISATGGVHWTIPLPNPFGVEVRNQPLSFNARKYADGSVSDEFEYHQVALGQSFNFHVEVTCLNVYDGNRAKIGGVIRNSNDPTLPAGGVRVVPGLRQRRGRQRPPRPLEPDRLRRRGRERGVLQQPQPLALRTVGRGRQRTSADVTRPN